MVSNNICIVDYISYGYVKAGLHQTRSHNVLAHFQNMIERVGRM